MKPDATLRTVLGDESVAERFALPRELLTTDRILRRWAASSGTGLPAEEWDDQPRARMPPLPDDVAIDVDLIITKSPPRTRRLVESWYRTPEPIEVIARKLGMSVRNAYRGHAVALHFMRYRFEGSYNAELVRLVKMIDP